MPLYEFQCAECGNIDDRFYRIAECPDMTPCSKCDSLAKKIMSCPMIKTDTPKWLDDQVRGAIQDDGEVPIRTRKDLKRVMAEKRIEPIETSHTGRRMI